MSKKPAKKRKKSFLDYVLTESPLDERQQLAATKISLEGIAIAFLLAIINICVMEDYYKWCESYSASTFLTIDIALLYIIVKRGVKGCLFGIKGARSELLMMGVWLFLGISQIGEHIKFAIWKWYPEMIRDGRLTLEFCNQLSFLLKFSCGIALAVFLIREKKAKERDNDNSEKE